MKVPEVSDLIDRCIIKVEKMINEAKSPTNLKSCVDILIAIDKNNRDLKIQLKERIIPDMTDEQIKSELERLNAKL